MSLSAPPFGAERELTLHPARPLSLAFLNALVIDSGRYGV